MINPSECIYLLHYTPPLELGATPFLLQVSSGGSAEVTSIQQLSKSNQPIVTHSFSLLVDWFRHSNLPLPKLVVDLEIAKKLVIGRPKSDFNIEKPWDMPSMLLKYVPSQYDAKQVRATLITHIAKPHISDFSNLRWMTAVAVKLPALWQQIQAELDASEERQRFEDVEIPVYNLMLKVQYQGLILDPIQRDRFLQSIEDDYITAHYQLSIQEDIDVERAFSDIDYLSSRLSYPLHSAETFSDTQQIVKARKGSDRICALLHKVASARRNKRILLRTVGISEGCFPIYDTMGTVTGRILTIDPELQHLSKRYRGIIKPRPGHSSIYIDYSQFEPNIMASISKDPQLLALCNSGDIYERLAFELCGGIEHRKTMKLLFLAYSYGKEVTSLSDFLMGIIESRREAETVIQRHFLPIFEGIEKWKASTETHLQVAGRIGTLLGNNRHRTRDGVLAPKERRWAISQVVQGTGSLILKKLLIELATSVPEAHVMLPMHDALLLEIPEEKSAALTEELLRCFRKVFSQTCPSVIPSVCEKDFVES
nr:DNA polymerase [Nitrosomonas nitrosa]